MDKKKIIKIVVLIAVICIPIMYSFFYLKSYWDPYGKLDQMKIAMVNLDEGENGVNLGQEFIDGLTEKNVVNVCQVTEEKAQEGLINEDYFAVITIPSNFTKYLSSASTTDKKVATITYSPNQKMNYLASQIINRVVTAAETELQSQVAEKVVDTLAENLKSVPESLEEINDGTDKLLDGANSLSSGLKEINNGVATLNNSYTEFDNGVNNAYAGSQTLTGGISQVNSGVGTLSQGANSLDSAITQINTGTATLSTSANNGVNDLVNGINQLSSGTAQVSAGTTALVAGTAADSELGAGAMQVANGATALVAGTSATSELGAGAMQVATGASTLNAGITNYVNTVNTLLPALVASGVIDAQTQTSLEQAGAGLTAGASSVSAGTNAVNSGIATLNAKAQTLSAGANAVSGGIGTLNAKIQDLDAGAKQVNAGATKLASQETTASLNQLVGGIGNLQSAISQVKSGTESLKTGVSTLSSGTNQLQSGSQNLTNGLGTLSSASSQVKTALTTLGSGTQSAYSGSLKLADGIKELKNGVSEGIDTANEELEKLDGLSEFVKDSVEIEEVDYGEVTAYGTAFTPLFISVGLWVGALMAYVVLYYDQDKRFKLLGKYADNKLVQCAMYLGISIVQGLVTAFLLNLGLDLNIQNYALYYGSAVLIAITFMSIIQFLILNFGEVGKFLALILLVLQLASSGGTFPVELIDEGFQKITPYMPMTYTIKLVKESIIKQEEGFAGKNIRVMMIYVILSLGLTAVIEILKKLKNKKDLKNQTA